MQQTLPLPSQRPRAQLDTAGAKRANGVFYTRYSPFALAPFKAWAHSAKLADTTVLEPFAGANSIITMLESEDLCREFASFDIAPTDGCVKPRDTIADFPTGYKACVTNPPWLARNSATRRGLPFPTYQYDDLYKYCLNLCLQHCDYVGALIPASFLQSGLFTDRLTKYILLHQTIFDDTKNPVCLALFNQQPGAGVDIYYDEERVGDLSDLRQYLPKPTEDKNIRFNDPEGDLGFISFDNTKEPTIRFCRAEHISRYSIKNSSRFITRIGGVGGNTNQMIDRLNRKINEFRCETKDVFLTPFKGLRLDGRYRRRMDYALARRFINAA